MMRRMDLALRAALVIYASGVTGLDHAFEVVDAVAADLGCPTDDDSLRAFMRQVDARAAEYVVLPVGG